MTNVIPTETSIDFGPGKLQKSNASDPFILAKSQYIDLQVYIATGKALPKNLAELKTSWNLTTSIDVSMFGALLPAYNNVIQHCTDWEANTLPGLRGLADDLYNYGVQVPDYYGALLDCLNTIASPTASQQDKDQARQDFKAVVDDLSTQIKAFIGKCQTVQAGVDRFRTQTKQDDAALSDLFKTYDQQYGTTNGELTRLNQQLEDARKTLKAAQDEYNHDVTVAATTPTYAWVGVLGLIAAAVVAGVYGDKAVKAKQAIEAANAQIATLGEQIQRDQNMLAQLNQAKTQVKALDDSLVKALAVINEVKDGWDSIGSVLADLNDRIDKISSDEVAAILKKTNIKTSITEWSDLKNDANNFRHHFTVDIHGSAISPVRNVTRFVSRRFAA
ncbi:MAG: hypothetical protein C4288_09860 [Leptolyngbya sp. ERB_1_1]